MARVSRKDSNEESGKVAYARRASIKQMTVGRGHSRQKGHGCQSNRHLSSPWSLPVL